MFEFKPLKDEKWSNFAQSSLFESKFDRIIRYENESKSLRRATGQDPLSCHRFRIYFAYYFGTF